MTYNLQVAEVAKRRLNILVSQIRVSEKGAAGNIPKQLKGIRENVKAFILPEKRKH
ncbi:hypothetical protein J1L44_004137 [Salmonella enterica subsp. enterica serovar Panama]|nr:hypothetical protein [Salmonella enterica subsp. enterica serovar Panama]